MKNPPAHTNGPPKNPGKPRLEQVARRLKTARPSFGQERLWLVQQLAPDSAAYSETSAIRVRGPLDVSLLERSVNEVVKRHEALRTAFAVVKGRPVQVILQSLAVSLRVHDLQGMPASERDAEAIRRLTADASQPFDLSQAPLFRSAVICLGHADHILAYTVHHIIGDARAVAILNEDVVIAYKDLALGQPISLAPLSTTYAEFARQQRAALEGRRMDELLGYWETRLTGSAPLNLPCDRPRPATPTFRGDVFTLRLPPELHHRLKLSGRSEGATPFITVLAALNVLLYRWTGQSDVSVGAAVSSRDRPELDRVIGFFVNTLVIRSDLSGELTFRELVARTGADFLKDYAHADLPFEYLVRRLGRSRDAIGSPLFNIAFAFNPEPYDGIQRAAGAYSFGLSPVPLHNHASKLDLAFLCWYTAEELSISLEYSTDLFEAATIKRLAGSFLTLLTASLENPDQSIRELPLLTAAQRKEILHDWNATQYGPAHPPNLHVRFEEQAAMRPEDPALEYEGRALSYGELNRRANQLANRLIARGVGPGKTVGLCLHRSLELITAVLAVWKSGAAYVAIDPSYPAGRVAWMIEDCRPALILAHPGISGLANQSAAVLELDEPWLAFADADDSNPNVAVRPSDLAYICYTSGSTGRPKGAMVCHRNLANHCESVLQHGRYWDRRRVLMVMSLSFDGAVLHIAIALTTGGALVLPGPAAVLPGPGMVDLLRSARINVAAIPPSVLALLPAEDLPDLETLAVGGEACPASLVQRWAPGRTMLNLYGPTEATVWATLAVCQPNGSPPPIGRPVANFRCYVLDDHGQPVPCGAPGELYLGGPSVCLGYLNRPELTAEKFVPDPFSLEPGARLYRTGDRCRWSSNGDLEFLGRIDHQVKVLGYRIELGEIEAALQDHPAVRQACVLARPDAANNLQLHAYVGIAPSDKDWTAELREWLRVRLPPYMLPARFTVLEKLPQGVHGKVDRAALERAPAEPAPQPITGDSAFSDKAIESLLTRIWADVLGTEQVTIDDNVFALGGESIMALQVASRARQEGIQLQPYEFFQHQTVAAQAAAAARNRETGATSLFTLDGLESGLATLLPLRTAGAKPPLFCVHHIAGLGLQYWDLARRLSPEQPVYALQSAGLDGRAAPRTSVEDMAACYVKEIRSIQPAGPYLLAGYSFGGVVAYEMAQQLTASGSNIALLGIIDRPVPDSLIAGSSVPAPLDAEWSIGVMRLVESLWGVRLASEEDVRPLSVDELLERILHAITSGANGHSGAAALRGAVEAAGEELLRNIFRVVEANAAASRRYEPRPFSGPITLFRAAERHASMNHDFAAIQEDPFLGWAGLSRHPISVHTIPGDHFSMIAPPHVNVLAARLQEALDVALRRECE